MPLKDLVIGTFWGNTFYRRVLQPFDRWHGEPQPVATFKTADLALNKVCRLSDSANPLWRQGFADLGFPDAGFTLDPVPDLRVEREYATPPLALPMQTFATPHIVLRNFHTIYTSVALFLMKPPAAPAENAFVGDEHVIHLEPYRYSAEVTPLDLPLRVIAGEPYSLALKLRNTGNVTWYADPARSHMVRAGAWFSAGDGRNLTGEPIRAGLPHHVWPGEQCEVVIRLTAPPHQAGVRLHVGLVKELCFWFRDQGGTDQVFPIEFA